MALGHTLCTKCGATATLESGEWDFPMCWAHGGNGEPSDELLNDEQRQALEEDASLFLDEQAMELERAEVAELDYDPWQDDNDTPEDDVDTWGGFDRDYNLDEAEEE
jgi:hypothetical protein